MNSKIETMTNILVIVLAVVLHPMYGSGRLDRRVAKEHGRLRLFSLTPHQNLAVCYSAHLNGRGAIVESNVHSP